MPVEILLAALVLAVVILVGADFFRTASDGPHEHAGDPAFDAGRETFAEPGAVATAFLPPPGRAGGVGQVGRAGQAFDAGPPRPPRRIGSPAGGRLHLDTEPAAPRRGSHGAAKSWLVRTRLSLLAVVSGVAAVFGTIGVIRAADAF